MLRGIPYLLLSLVLGGTMGAYRRKPTKLTTRPPITLSPLELETALGDDASFRHYQLQRYEANPHWFRQPGRPCNSSADIKDLFLTNRSALPTDAQLIAIGRNFCWGFTSPTASIDLMACRPETRICDCFHHLATWDARNRMCRMLPGAFCIPTSTANHTSIPCVHGATCLDGQCVCAPGQTCLDHKVSAPDPGPPGDPASWIVPLPTKEPWVEPTTTKDPTYL